MDISIKCRSSLVRIATVLSSDAAEKSLPLSISITKGSSNGSSVSKLIANAGIHRIITIAQERTNDRSRFIGFISVSFLCNSH